MSKEHLYLESAMEQAERAYKTRTYPIGAVIVSPDGNIIGRGYNHVYSRGDYTSHAETEAIRNAGPRLMLEPNFEACTLYTTMEPCLMCCGAILIARIKRVIWVINDEQYGALRYLCGHCHSLNASLQEKALEVNFSEDRPLPERNGTGAASGRFGDKVPPFSRLPAGYTDKIANLSILPAGDPDLALRMGSLMENWNAMKEDVLSQRRHEK